MKIGIIILPIVCTGAICFGWWSMLYENGSEKKNPCVERKIK